MRRLLCRRFRQGIGRCWRWDRRAYAGKHVALQSGKLLPCIASFVTDAPLGRLRVSSTHLRLPADTCSQTRRDALTTGQTCHIHHRHSASTAHHLPYPLHPETMVYPSSYTHCTIVHPIPFPFSSHSSRTFLALQVLGSILYAVRDGNISITQLYPQHLRDRSHPHNTAYDLPQLHHSAPSLRKCYATFAWIRNGIAMGAQLG